MERPAPSIIEDLKRIRSYNADMKRLEEQQKECIERARGLTRQLNGMPHGSGVRDTIGDAVARIDELERRIADEIVGLIETRTRILEMLSGLTAEERQVIQYRFFDGYKVARIASRMGYERKQISRFQRSAIEKLENMSQNVSKDMIR